MTKRVLRYDHDKKKVVEVEPKTKARKSDGSFMNVVGAYSEAKPLVSEGLGCMKSQVPEMRKAIRDRGIVGAHVKDNGQIEFTSRRARKQVGKMRGLHDNDGGYGD